jgi:hypothetical protein
MIYFLRTAPEVAANPVWSAILPTYFETLKAEYGSELAELPEGASKEVRWEAGKRAREKAVDAAFHDVDLQRIEIAWSQYVEGLELP